MLIPPDLGPFGAEEEAEDAAGEAEAEADAAAAAAGWLAAQPESISIREAAERAELRSIFMSDLL
jgi:hypothetical protein